MRVDLSELVAAKRSAIEAELDRIKDTPPEKIDNWGIVFVMVFFFLAWLVFDSLEKLFSDD